MFIENYISKLRRASHCQYFIQLSVFAVNILDLRGKSHVGKHIRRMCRNAAIISVTYLLCETLIVKQYIVHVIVYIVL